MEFPWLHSCSVLALPTSAIPPQVKGFELTAPAQRRAPPPADTSPRDAPQGTRRVGSALRGAAPSLGPLGVAAGLRRAGLRWSAPLLPPLWGPAGQVLARWRQRVGNAAESLRGPGVGASFCARLFREIQKLPPCLPPYQLLMSPSFQRHNFKSKDGLLFSLDHCGHFVSSLWYWKTLDKLICHPDENGEHRFPRLTPLLPRFIQLWVAVKQVFV